MIHKMARQHDTCVFSEILSVDLPQFSLMKKKLFWGVNRWEEDALVVDPADYGMVRSLLA